MKGHDMATIRDVAELAEVSIATVSRVFNSPELVLPETLKAVENAIKTLNYHPQRRRKKLTNLFGVIFPEIENPFFAELLDVLEHEAYLNGRCILFFNSKHNARQEMLAFKECEAHGVDGVFWIPAKVHSEDYFEIIRTFNFYTVLLTQTAQALPSVAVDHFEGGRQKGYYIASQGHENIAYIGVISPEEDKYQGFISAIEAKGLRIKEETNCFDITQNSYVKKFVEKILSQKNKQKVTAIVCGNDVWAQKAYEICQEMNIRVPQEVELVGFDNSLLSKILKFTSVSQPMREIAHVGFSAMLNEIKNGAKRQSYTAQLLLPKLIIRNTINE